VRDAGSHLSVGERIAFYRRRRGLTQRVLAGLVGRSEDWLSKIERGEREPRRLDVLVDVAKALRVTVGDLLGQPILVQDDQVSRGDDVPAIRDALMAPRRLSRRLYGRDVSIDVDPDGVARLTELVWMQFQDGRLGHVIEALPGLIESAQQLEDAPGDPGHDAWAVSARMRCSPRADMRTP